MDASRPAPPTALDASVLLRYVLADDAIQSPLARDLIESNRQLAITAVTLAEAAWVLTGPRLQIDRTETADVLLRLLARENASCVGLDKSEAQAALIRCRAPGAADFGDALTAACARSGGISQIFTFDRDFSRAGLTAVEPPGAA